MLKVPPTRTDCPGSVEGKRDTPEVRPICFSPFLWECLTSVVPGRWSGQSGKELVLAKAFLHPETERQATEVGRYGGGVWFEHRSLAWFQVPCAEQWLTVGPTQLIPFGRVSSIAHLGRCLQLRKRPTSEKEKKTQRSNPQAQDAKPKRRRRSKGMCLEDRPVLEPNAAGIDVGDAREMFVAVPPGRDENPVRVFATFTEDLERLTDWLEQCGVTAVALESTGVYWIPLFEILEQPPARIFLAPTWKISRLLVSRGP
jgi:hypothetical protein